jgi:hypothetical protein
VRGQIKGEEEGGVELLACGREEEAEEEEEDFV